MPDRNRRPETELPRNPQHLTEAHPSPQGEQDVVEMPLETDVTGENAGQNTSTRGNCMNPVVRGPLEDPTTDSMFNLADPQTREIEESRNKTALRARKPRRNVRSLKNQMHQ